MGRCLAAVVLVEIALVATQALALVGGQGRGVGPWRPDTTRRMRGALARSGAPRRIRHQGRRRQVHCEAAALGLSPVALRASIGAVTRLVAICSVGATYASRGILNAKACGTLSRLIYYMFQPAMLFVNCATTVAASKSLGMLAVFPVFAGLQICMGALFGTAVLMLLGKKEDISTRETRALCTFGNAGPLPLVFAEAFFRDCGDPTLMPRAVAYISMYLLGWSPLFWTLGPAMLAPSAVAEQTAQEKRQAFMKRVVTPPVLASILGVLIGAVEPFRQLLIPLGAPLRPLTDALRTIGSGYLPSVALVLAGTLARSFGLTPEKVAPPADAEASADTIRSVSIPLPARLAIIAICRFIWLPVASFCLLSSVQLWPKDPLLRFVLLMAGSMPSAQNAIVLLQLNDDDEESQAGATSIAKTLAFLYVLAVIPMSILLSFALQLAPLQI